MLRLDTSLLEWMGYMFKDFRGAYNLTGIHLGGHLVLARQTIHTSRFTGIRRNH